MTSTAERHQIEIEWKTLRMPDAMADVIGAPSREEAFAFLQARGLLVDCGGCGHFHPKGFDGDCRDDDNRF